VPVAGHQRTERPLAILVLEISWAAHADQVVADSMAL
jgi:hypothetical protein